MVNLEDLTKDFEEVREVLFIRTPELGEILLNDLKKEGKIALDTKSKDVLERDFYDDKEFINFVEEGIKRAKGREALGENGIYCHASPNKKEGIIIGETCISTLDAIYLGGGRKPVNYFHIVTPGKFSADERAPPNAEGKWFTAFNGCRVLESYSLDNIDEFLRKYPSAKFVGYVGDDKLRKMHPSMKFI